jgi:hypothetical protein
MTGLGWRHLAERTWPELVAAGLPAELAELGQDVSNLTGRPVLVYTMPMEQVGVSGVALPFISDDGVVIDPCLLRRPRPLAATVAHELAHILHPWWPDLDRDQQDEMETFALVLGPALLDQLPRTTADVSMMVDSALGQCKRASRRRCRGGGLAG